MEIGLLYCLAISKNERAVEADCSQKKSLVLVDINEDVRVEYLQLSINLNINLFLLGVLVLT